MIYLVILITIGLLSLPFIDRKRINCKICHGRGWIRINGRYGSSRIEDCKCIK